VKIKGSSGNKTFRKVKSLLFALVVIVIGGIFFCE